MPSNTPAPHRRPYSPEDTRLPTTAAELLDWAAAHVVHVGLHQGEGMFGSSGQTRTVRLRASMAGALDVAGGDGRLSTARTYDWLAIDAARHDACDVLSDYLAGGALTLPEDWPDEDWYRRYYIQQWGHEDGRTAEDAAAAFSAAARLAERAAAVAAARPGRPPRRLRPATTTGLLAWMAAHLEDVTLWGGVESHDPAGFADTAPCTVLHAFDRAQRAAIPGPGEYPKDWEGSAESRVEALLLLSDLVAGGPVDDGPEPLEEWGRVRREYDRARTLRRRGVVARWGAEPGRTTWDVVETLREAARLALPEDEPVSAIADTESAGEPGQVELF